MPNQATILGSGLVTSAVLVLNAFVTGSNVLRPVLGVAIAILLLASLDAAGLGAIAAPMAVLLGGTVIFIYALPLLQAVGGKI